MRRTLMLAGLVLVGCSGPYSVESQTPQQVSICWDPILYREQRAMDDAARHCAQRNMTPIVELRARCGLGDVNRLTTFRCVRPE